MKFQITLMALVLSLSSAAQAFEPSMAANTTGKAVVAFMSAVGSLTWKNPEAVALVYNRDLTVAQFLPYILESRGMTQDGVSSPSASVVTYECDEVNSIGVQICRIKIQNDSLYGPSPIVGYTQTGAVQFLYEVAKDRLVIGSKVRFLSDEGQNN